MKKKYYIRTVHGKNEFKICDEYTDEIIAIFYDQSLAIEYVNIINN